MKPQIRVLLILAILALAAGWASLRRGNAELVKRLAARPAGAAEVAR
ncbi:MAG TPA: hypothetical protein VFR85_18780 [Anaeromyxobacteraceae bacterium]|nr:hypothetical protein [Anaeromyxobacteraceae bacterium]